MSGVGERHRIQRGSSFQPHHRRRDSRRPGIDAPAENRDKPLLVLKGDVDLGTAARTGLHRVGAEQDSDRVVTLDNYRGPHQLQPPRLWRQSARAQLRPSAGGPPARGRRQCANGNADRPCTPGLHRVGGCGCGHGHDGRRGRGCSAFACPDAAACTRRPPRGAGPVPGCSPAARRCIHAHGAACARLRRCQALPSQHSAVARWRGVPNHFMPPLAGPGPVLGLAEGV